jgi:hypothetical protein
MTRLKGSKQNRRKQSIPLSEQHFQEVLES